MADVALLTGATGFVGLRLAQALLRDGWQVHAIVRAGSADDRVRMLRGSGAELHVHDGTTTSLVTLVAAVRPVVVWHLATRFTSTHAVDDVEPLVRDNILFGAQLLESMSRSGARSLVVAGSAWQQHDNADYAPVSLYAATKQAFEAMAAWYAEVRDLRVVVTRLSDVYGPGDTRRKLVWALAEAERTGNALPMNDGSPYIDLLHVDDAVAALRVAGDRAVARAGGMEHWAVRGGRSMPLRELVALWQQVRGTTFPVQWGALPLRAREATTPWTAGDVLPEWMPAIRLEDGLRGL